jgi:hypothetical protein
MNHTDEILNEISIKLDKMVKLMALDAVRSIEREQDKISLLDSLGFRPVEIAGFLNKTQENVNVQLGQIRKKKEPRISQPNANPQIDAKDKRTGSTSGPTSAGPTST